jgi:hypothetical protein
MFVRGLPPCAADLKQVAVTAGADRAQLAFADQLKVAESDGKAAFTLRCCDLRNVDAADAINAARYTLYVAGGYRYIGHGLSAPFSDPGPDASAS